MLSNFLELHSPMPDIETRDRKLTLEINLTRWTYRIYPTVLHKPFAACDVKRFSNWLSNYEAEDKRLHVSPVQYRWKPQTIPTDNKVTFIEGITSMGGAGTP